MSNDPGAINCKTVRLAKGSHSGPTDGACVMELASMIAGERFSDHPNSVCPVIGAFLRAYNDSVDNRRRQDLYRCASSAIGTRGSSAVERRRVQRCLAWAQEMRARRGWLVRKFKRVGMAAEPLPQFDYVAWLAVKSIGRHTDATHECALALVDELCAMGTDSVQSAPVDHAPAVTA